MVPSPGHKKQTCYHVAELISKRPLAPGNEKVWKVRWVYKGPAEDSVEGV